LRVILYTIFAYSMKTGGDQMSNYDMIMGGAIS